MNLKSVRCQKSSIYPSYWYGITEGKTSHRQHVKTAGFHFNNMSFLLSKFTKTRMVMKTRKQKPKHLKLLSILQCELSGTRAVFFSSSYFLALYFWRSYFSWPLDMKMKAVPIFHKLIWRYSLIAPLALLRKYLPPSKEFISSVLKIKVIREIL